MRRLAGLAAILAAAVAVVAATTASGHSRRAAQSTTVQITAHQTSFNTAGNGLGAVTTFTDDLFRQGTKVGSDRVACVTTGPGGVLECYASDLLPAGQIQSIGTFDPATQTHFTVSIVGGTADYRDARGTIEIVLLNQTESTYIYSIDE
jgi:hypothetical protein